MRTVYKYPISLDGTTKLKLYGTILHVGLQDGQIKLWAIYDDSNPPVEVQFYVAGTGHQIPERIDKSKHIGTCVGPVFVWHVFAERTD